MNKPAPDSFYNVRGTMPSTSPSYVKRRADDQLHEALSRGEYCFVLTSRQVGKSSLMARAAVTMRADKAGAAVVVLDITSQGENVTFLQWYGGMLDQIGEQLDIEDELEADWRAHADVGALPRWIGAIVRVALPALGKRRLVIFIDEVDFTRTLKFATDEFFAGIRECYNRRTVDPEMSRLTFCLIGSARPFDLIRDVRTTPFNIGQRIDLTDFTLEEALPLARALHASPKEARAMLERVLHWTGGHPYLTQQLCRAVAADPAKPGLNPKRRVDAVSQRLFFSPRGRDNDDNLVFVRDRILKSEEDLGGVLDIYRKVLDRKPIKSEDNNPLIGVLRLAGITRLVDQRLIIRNRIYRRVFDRKWVDANMPDQEKRRLRAAYRRGLIRLGVPAAVIIAIVSALAGYALVERASANKARDQAQNSLKQANEAKARVSQVLEAAYKANGDFLSATEFTGMSGATRDLVVEAALGQLTTLQKDASVKTDRDIQFKVAGAYDAIGSVQLKMLGLEIGKPEEPDKSFRTALSIRQELAKNGPLSDLQEMHEAADLQSLGIVGAWPRAVVETIQARNARLTGAAGNFREALTIVTGQFSRHPNEPEHAAAMAGTLVALGDFLRENKLQDAPADLKSPGEYYQQAVSILNGPHSLPPEGADETGDNPATSVVSVHASALEKLGLLLAGDPGTRKAAAAHLEAAANESAGNADLYVNDPRRSNSRERVNLSLDAARKTLELAKFLSRTGNRDRARSELERSAAYLGGAPGASQPDGAPRAKQLMELVPVNIDVRNCLAEVYSMLAYLDAADGDTAQSHDCVAALEMCRRATQERLVIHELNPGSQKAIDALALAYLRQGDAAFRGKGAREALASYVRAREVYSRAKTDAPPLGLAQGETDNALIATALEGMGVAKLSMGNFTEAGQHLQVAVADIDALDPKAANSALQRQKARVLSTLGDNWRAQKENSTAVRECYTKAIEIQERLASQGPTPSSDDSETFDQRLELARSRIGRASARGSLRLYEKGHEDLSAGARADADAAAAELKALAHIDSGSPPADALLLEHLINAHIDLARAWKSLEDWQRAAATLDDAEALIRESKQRDTQSFVCGVSDTELFVLRAEVNYGLWLATSGAPTSQPAGGWQKAIDQQGNYLRFYASGRNRDPDSYRVLGQYTTILRYAGLFAARGQPLGGGADGLGDRDVAEHLLKDALKYREVGSSRYPIDVNVADMVLESFEDLNALYCQEGKNAEIERIRAETVDAINNLDASYKSESSPKLSAEMALAKLYRLCENKESADRSRQAAADLTVKADRCAQAIKDRYPDAVTRWTEYRDAVR